MLLIKRLHFFRDEEAKREKTDPRYYTVEDKTRILKAHKRRFSVANLNDCFNASRSTIYRFICKKTITKMICGSQKAITTKQVDSLINITLKSHRRISLCVTKKDDSSVHSYCFLRRWTKKLELLQVSPDIELTLCDGHKKALMDFVREFRSRRASFWRLVFSSDECMLCDESLSAQKKSFVWRQFPAKSCVLGPKDLASIGTLY